MNKKQHLCVAVLLVTIIFLVMYFKIVNPIIMEIKNKKRSSQEVLVSVEPIKNYISEKESMAILIKKLTSMQLDVNRVEILSRENNVPHIAVECRGKPSDFIRFLAIIANEEPWCILSEAVISGESNGFVKAVLQYIVVSVNQSNPSAIINVSFNKNIFSKPVIIITDR